MFLSLTKNSTVAYVLLVLFELSNNIMMEKYLRLEPYVYVNSEFISTVVC